MAQSTGFVSGQVRVLSPTMEVDSEDNETHPCDSEEIVDDQSDTPSEAHNTSIEAEQHAKVSQNIEYVIKKARAAEAKITAIAAEMRSQVEIMANRAQKLFSEGGSLTKVSRRCEKCGLSEIPPKHCPHIICYYCKKRGHVIRICRFRKANEKLKLTN